MRRCANALNALTAPPVLRVLTSAKAEPKAHRRKPWIHPSAHAHSDGSGTRRSGPAPGRTYCRCTLCVCGWVGGCLLPYGRRPGAERGRVRVVVRVGRPQGNSAERLMTVRQLALRLAPWPAPLSARALQGGSTCRSRPTGWSTPSHSTCSACGDRSAGRAARHDRRLYSRTHDDRRVRSAAAMQDNSARNVQRVDMRYAPRMHHTPHHAIAACSKQHAT
jgi:hypothetical protein